MENNMNVNQLIKHLQFLVKEDKDIGEMHIRVLEDSAFEDDGDAKGNFWIDQESQIMVCPLPNGSFPSDEDFKGELILRGQE